MKHTYIPFVQSQLNAKGLNVGVVDGICGKNTVAALDQVEGMAKDWTRQRKAIAFIQLLAKQENIETGGVDGYWGPQTELAFEMLQEQTTAQPRPPTAWRPEELPDTNPNNWAQQTPETALTRFYGEVGKHQTLLNVPYPHILAWNTKQVIHRFSCHEKVHDSLHRVLSNVLSHYGLDEIQRLHLDLFGGCLNVRKMRGGSRYSAHSWGIAVDYNPSENPLKWGRDRAAFAQPVYDAWWKIWESEGWVSLGRTRNFDWMHVQAAKL